MVVTRWLCSLVPASPGTLEGGHSLPALLSLVREPVLRNVSLSVGRGELVGVVGKVRGEGGAGGGCRQVEGGEGACEGRVQMVLAPDWI